MPQTGPNTKRGKAVVSRNAEKHGILSTTPVIEGVEDPAEWEAHVRGMIESLEPEGHHETVLVHNIATDLWRKARVVRYETEMLSLDLDFDDEADTLAILTGKAKATDVQRTRAAQERRQFIAARLIPGEMTGPKIMRYEAHVHRLYIQTLHEFEASQTRRRGGITPLARVDFTGAPGG